MLPTQIPLPDSWRALVRVAILHVLASSRFVFLNRGARAAGCSCMRCGELEREVHLLREELRGKDARMEAISPRKRPDYSAAGRFDILALRASRGWSKAEAARRFLVCEATIRAWTNRVMMHLFRLVRR